MIFGKLATCSLPSFTYYHEMGSLHQYTIPLIPLEKSVYARQYLYLTITITI